MTGASGCLIVPIDVAALCVGQADVQAGATTLAPSADFSKLPYASEGARHNTGPYISAQALVNGEAFAGELALAHGIHLHWALPDGLTHGIQSDGSTPVAFPCAPNRWLVTRIVGRPDGTSPSPASWVIESDRLSPVPTAATGPRQPTIPLAPTPGQNFRYLGQAFPLASWREQQGGERLKPLTAVGYGEATFAAFYPNCATAFGFHDPLEDLGEYDPHTCTLTYHVAGWYSDPSSDPLTGGKLDPHENRYAWSFTAGAAPTTTLCSGAIDGITWDPSTAYLGAQPAPLKAAVACSTAEALSALFAHELSAENPSLFAGAEQLLNALQFGLLSNSGRPDAVAAFEADVHGAGFASLQAGLLWSISATAAAGGEQVTLHDAIAAELNELNGLQTRLDALSQELETRQLQLFVDWYKYLLVRYNPEHVPSELVQQLAAIERHLTQAVEEIGAIAGADGSATLLQAQIDDRAGALRGKLEPPLTLVAELSAPRYYQPNDPVLVLCGQDVQPVTRYGKDGSTSPGGYLPCRLDGELVSCVSLAAGAVPGASAIQIPATALPAPVPAPADAPAAQLQELLREAILLCPALAPTVAAAAAGLGGGENPAVLDFGATVAQLRAASSSFLGARATAPTYTGHAPDPILLAGWNGTPWLPILLQYEIELRPVHYVDPSGAPYPPGFLNQQFQLHSDGVELQYTGSQLQPQVQQYSGTVILTPGATVDLADEIRRYIDSGGEQDAELQDVLQMLATLPLLSQGLSGCGQAMLMRKQTLQMPVADPFASVLTSPFVASVARAVGEQNTLAPLPQESFNPIRAGALTITRLRLVDVFGRCRDHAPPEVLAAKALAPPPQLSLASGCAFLQPRIVQPARLQFRWLSSYDDQLETNSHPATSPILGWVVPNYLDDSVAIYDSSGAALGELGSSGDGHSSMFTPAPGGAFPLETGVEAVFADANEHLRDFAIGIHNGGDGSFLAPFLATMHHALALTLPASFRQDAASSVLLGQPLVLARARLAIDLYGPAATDESWTGFAAAVLRDAAPDDAGLTAVQIPIELGALAQLDDTLVGYWTDTGAGPQGYRRYYSQAARESSGGVGPPGQDTVTLVPSFGDGDGLTLTLLLDPRGCVHASTGVLPVKSIAIPRDQYAAALASIAATFAVRPLLSGSSRDGMVAIQPKLAARQWSWVQVAARTWSTQPLTDQPSGQATLSYSPQSLAEGWMRMTGQLPPKTDPENMR